MGKDKRGKKDYYNADEEEKLLRKLEPYKKLRKPTPPPSRFFKKQVPIREHDAIMDEFINDEPEEIFSNVDTPFEEDDDGQ